MSDLNKIISDKPFKYNEPIRIGKCCNADGSGTYTSNKTQRECLNSNGIWVTDSMSCPKQTKKTCCRYGAGGTVVKTDNITECTCYKTSGGSKVRWGDYSSGCPVISPLIASTSACCHWVMDGDNYVNKCVQTSSLEDCIALHQGASAGLKYAYYEGKSCISSGGDIMCTGTNKTQDTIIDECSPDTTTECNKEENILGNCCEQFDDETISCSITTKNNCNGFWNYFGYIKSCTTGSLCSGVYFQNKENGKSTPPTASYTTLATSSNILEKLPSNYSLYQGGLYAGIFEPGVSNILGNNISGKGQTYKSNRNGPGTTNRRWIIIVSPFSTMVPRLSLGKINTSTYDGFYNIQKQPLENISEQNINGFTDWYIPSKQELEFIFKNLGKNYTTSGFETLYDEYYLTSTVLNVSSDISFVYSQMNTQEKFGDVFVTPEQNVRYDTRVRLIRRIYLGT